MAWRQEHGKPGHAAPLDGDKDLAWKPGGGGQAAKERAKELRKYAEQRALQKEAAREERKAEKEAAKEAASASSAASASAEGERPICKFFELGKCNKGAKCKFRHEVAAAAPEDGDAGDAAEAFDVIAKMPADAWLHIISRLGVAGACSMAACCSALAAVVATKGVWEEKRDQLFGGGGGGAGGASSSEAPTARHECCVSEASLRGWARAAVEPAQRRAHPRVAHLRGDRRAPRGVPARRPVREPVRVAAVEKTRAPAAAHRRDRAAHRTLPMRDGRRRHRRRECLAQAHGAAARRAPAV